MDEQVRYDMLQMATTTQNHASNNPGKAIRLQGSGEDVKLGMSALGPDTGSVSELGAMLKSKIGHDPEAKVPQKMRVGDKWKKT